MCMILSAIQTSWPLKRGTHSNFSKQANRIPATLPPSFKEELRFSKSTAFLLLFLSVLED